MEQPYRARSSRRVGPAGIALALLALVLSMALPAAAGMGKGDGEIGFDFGVTDLDTDYSQDEAAGLTFRGGVFITDLVEIEGQLAAYTASNLYSSHVTLKTLMVDAVFNFRPNTSVMPYVLVGTGIANVDYDRWWDDLPSHVIDDSSIAFQAGGGSRFFFGKAKKVAVRVDLTVLNEKTFERSATPARFTVGFTWRLGGAGAATPPAAAPATRPSAGRR